MVIFLKVKHNKKFTYRNPGKSFAKVIFLSYLPIIKIQEEGVQERSYIVNSMI
jgi:hypothetical protein